MSQHITKNNCIEKSTPVFDKGSISTFTESINIHEYVTNILTLYKNLQFPLFTSHGNNVVCTTIFDCDLFGSPFLFETLGTNLTAYKLILDMKIISSHDEGFCIVWICWVLCTIHVDMKTSNHWALATTWYNQLV